MPPTLVSAPHLIRFDCRAPFMRLTREPCCGSARSWWSTVVGIHDMWRPGNGRRVASPGCDPGEGTLEVSSLLLLGNLIDELTLLVRCN